MLFEMIYKMEINVTKRHITMEADLALCVLRGRGDVQESLFRGGDPRAEAEAKRSRW